MDTEERTNHWQRHLELWRASGLNQTEYCRQAGLNRSAFVYWKRRLETMPSDRSAIIPVTIPFEKLSGKPFRLTTPSGYKLDIPDVFCKESLRDILSVVSCKC